MTLLPLQNLKVETGNCFYWMYWLHSRPSFLAWYWVISNRRKSMRFMLSFSRSVLATQEMIFFQQTESGKILFGKKIGNFGLLARRKIVNSFCSSNIFFFCNYGTRFYRCIWIHSARIQCSIRTPVVTLFGIQSCNQSRTSFWNHKTKKLSRVSEKNLKLISPVLFVIGLGFTGSCIVFETTPPENLLSIFCADDSEDNCWRHTYTHFVHLGGKFRHHLLVFARTALW